MADPFKNARAFYDVTVPSSGDGFQFISQIKNALQGIGSMDMIPLQPRAHSPADNKIMVRGTDASGFYRPIYGADTNSRVYFSSGDSPAISAPSSSPRIDIVYITPSGDIRVVTGTEAASPTLPTLAPSGDTRLPVCAIYNRPSQTKIFNFEDSAANTGDAYIYQDLRPWLQQPKAVSSTSFSATTPVSPTGDAQAGPGVSTSAARSDHVHGGVHAIRVVGQSNLQGDVEFAGSTGALTQSAGRITFNQKFLQTKISQTAAVAQSTGTAIDDNTVPQLSECPVILTALNVSIASASAINTLIITVVLNLDVDSSATTYIVAIFLDAGTSAVAAARWSPTNTAGHQPIPCVLQFFITPADTASHTYKIGIGGLSGAVLTMNGSSGSQLMGGVLYSSMRIDEIAT